MGQEGIPLHLTKPDASSPLATLHRLVGQDIDGPSRADLEFVRDHVPQPLVVDHAHEDVHLQLPTIHPIVHPLVAIEIVSS